MFGHWTGVISYVIISDYLSHDKYAVDVFNRLIIADLKGKLQGLQVIDIFSDGAGQHFKQKFTISNITFYEMELGVKCNWHFFATSHGKGAVDGVGGTVKRAVYKAIMAEQAYVNNFTTFAACARKTVKAVHILTCSKELVDNRKAILDEKWVDILPIPSTHTIHCFRHIDIYKVNISKTSLSTNSVTFHFKNESTENDASTPTTAAGFSIQEEKEIVQPLVFGINDWVLVKYISQRYTSAKFYVGNIVKCGLITSVKFMMLHRLSMPSIKFVWNTNCELCDVDNSQIVAKLPAPQCIRGLYSFEGFDFKEFSPVE